VGPVKPNVRPEAVWRRSSLPPFPLSGVPLRRFSTSSTAESPAISRGQSRWTHLKDNGNARPAVVLGASLPLQRLNESGAFCRSRWPPLRSERISSATTGR
jgi:hypothetical protein